MSKQNSVDNVNKNPRKLFYEKEVTFHSLPRIISDSFVKVSTHALATLTCPLFSYSKYAELKI